MKLGKASVNYRLARIRARRRCGNCAMFRAGHPNRCTLVRGLIDARGICDRWAPKGKP